MTKWVRCHYYRGPVILCSISFFFPHINHRWIPILVGHCISRLHLGRSLFGWSLFGTTCICPEFSSLYFFFLCCCTFSPLISLRRLGVTRPYAGDTAPQKSWSQESWTNQDLHNISIRNEKLWQLSIALWMVDMWIVENEVYWFG